MNANLIKILNFNMYFSSFNSAMWNLVKVCGIFKEEL